MSLQKNNKKEKFLFLAEVISKRRDIHFYKENKDIPIMTIKEVMEYALRSPSSYGLEPWYVLAIKRRSRFELIKSLFPFFQNNRQILRCSYLFFIFSYRGKAFNFFTPFFHKKVEWKYGDQPFKNKLKGSWKLLWAFNPFEQKKIDNWARQQCFIPLQNFLLLFTSLGIATSPMGGYDEKKVLQHLENSRVIPKGKYNLAVTFAAGYPLNEEQWEKKLSEKEWENFKIVE